MAMKPMKPVIDGEPVYEDIPQGLHDPNETRWHDGDVRRYAYWSVFAGSFGHTYGHNDIMQFIKPGVIGAFGADGSKKTWVDALRSRIQSDEIFEESDVECSLFRAHSRSECDCRSKR